MFPLTADFARWLDADPDRGAILFLMELLSVVGIGLCLYALKWTRLPIQLRRYAALVALVLSALAFNLYFGAVVTHLGPAPYPVDPVGSIRNGGSAVPFGIGAALILAFQMVRQAIRSRALSSSGAT